MRELNNKRSKKEQVETIRSYIAGEDVSLQFEPAIVPVFAETKHCQDEDTYEINGKTVSLQEFNQIVTQSKFVWNETRVYSEQELISDATFNDSMMTEGECQVLIVPAIEPENNSQSIEARELQNRSKQYLSDKLKEFSEQEKIDLELRNKSIIWQRMNKEFL